MAREANQVSILPMPAQFNLACTRGLEMLVQMASQVNRQTVTTNLFLVFFVRVTRSPFVNILGFSMMCRVCSRMSMLEVSGIHNLM